MIDTQKYGLPNSSYDKLYWISAINTRNILNLSKKKFFAQYLLNEKHFIVSKVSGRAYIWSVDYQKCNGHVINAIQGN